MTPVIPDPGSELIVQAWEDLVAAAPPVGSPDPLEVTGRRGDLSSRLPVEGVAVACVGAALLAAGALHRHRGGELGRPRVDRGHVAAAVRSERHFRRRARSGAPLFAPLSRFWRTADGWVRTHANYPWHRQAMLAALGTSDAAEAVAGAMAERQAEDVEADILAAGGIAGAVRDLDRWRDHPQGRAVAAEPLISHRLAGHAEPRRRSPAGLPAAGVRVLDLTRVIAGPVCTRYLAALGADVLRLDPPDRPDMHPGEATDTLLGKRSALLDLESRAAAAVLHELLGQADVVVCGYRPGALDRFGLTEDELAERHPGLVIVLLDAWGHTGPWASRRGFDSIVQAPTGIAMIESRFADEPGTLPCQLLDHGTGYLAAAAALDSLRRQAEHGGTHARRLSLARTAWWLTTAAPAAATAPADVDTNPTRWLTTLDSANGPVTAVLPPGQLAISPLRWPRPLTGYGHDTPTWTSPTAAGPNPPER